MAAVLWVAYGESTLASRLVSSSLAPSKGEILFFMAKDFLCRLTEMELLRLSDNLFYARHCHSDQSEESHGFRNLRFRDSSANASE
jgi:hypothetical protein